MYVYIYNNGYTRTYISTYMVHKIDTGCTIAWLHLATSVMQILCIQIYIYKIIYRNVCRCTRIFDNFGRVDPGRVKVSWFQDPLGAASDHAQNAPSRSHKLHPTWNVRPNAHTQIHIYICINIYVYIYMHIYIYIVHIVHIEIYTRGNKSRLIKHIYQ